MLVFCFVAESSIAIKQQKRQFRSRGRIRHNRQKVQLLRLRSHRAQHHQNQDLQDPTVDLIKNLNTAAVSPTATASGSGSNAKKSGSFTPTPPPAKKFTPQPPSTLSPSNKNLSSPTAANQQAAHARQVSVDTAVKPQVHVPRPPATPASPSNATTSGAPAKFESRAPSTPLPRQLHLRLTILRHQNLTMVNRIRNHLDGCLLQYYYRTVPASRLLVLPSFPNIFLSQVPLSVSPLVSVRSCLC